jgi:bacterioferritin (cytochrome b1)
MINALVERINQDLKNEWKHHCFYLHNASNIVGLHAKEYKEWLLEQAASEMQHIVQFSDLITGLGGSPTKEVNNFPSLSDPREILEYAAKMEEEVINNYYQRIADAEKINDLNSYWVVIFLEKQMEDSRKDLDEIRQMLKGI